MGQGMETLERGGHAVGGRQMTRRTPEGCGCGGCRGPAVARVSIPEKGDRVVCHEHINGHRVTAWFGGVDE